MTHIKYNAVVTQSFAKQIAESIRSSILEGHLRVDERLPTENELSERFSVSRPTVREAIKRLAAQNLVRSQRGPSGGTFVTHPSQEQARSSLAEALTLLVSMGEFNLEEIAEARLDLELVCVQHAITRRTDEHLHFMRRELALQKTEIKETAFCESDVRFHRGLADATNNALLQFIMTTVVEALQPLTNMIIVHIRERKRLVQQHEDLLIALEDRNHGTAKQAIEAKMTYLVAQYHEAKRQKET